MATLNRLFAFLSPTSLLIAVPFAAVLFVAGCDNANVDEIVGRIVAPRQPAPVDDESAPRSTDFDTDGKNPTDHLDIFPVDEPDVAVNAKPEPVSTNPLEDLSIAVQGTKTLNANAEPWESIDLSKFHEGTASQRKRFAALVDYPAPRLAVSDWMHSDPVELADLQGKIVVLDFWATWCGTCIRAIPHNNELSEKYADKGVVLIGICAARGSEKMEAMVTKYDIQYPVAVDDGTTIKSYQVNGFPDYYIIDRSGKLRIADCKNNSVEAAIEALLAEKN